MIRRNIAPAKRPTINWDPREKCTPASVNSSVRDELIRWRLTDVVDHTAARMVGKTFTTRPSAFCGCLFLKITPALPLTHTLHVLVPQLREPSRGLDEHLREEYLRPDPGLLQSEFYVRRLLQSESSRPDTTFP